MTTPSSGSMNRAGTGFDSGPLSWVIGEIRQTLDRSKTALFEALAQRNEVGAGAEGHADVEANACTALLHQAKAHLHQAHGALQIVDVDGVAILTETVEDLFDRIDSGQLTLDAAMTQAIEHAYQALVEYLEELLAGAPHQPVRLFPYYQALLTMRGAERIHPADLFFPSLAIRPKLPLAEAATQVIDYVALRKRFEQSLLPFLKSGGAAERNDVVRMHTIIGEVERAQTNQQSRGFWWVMRGFAEAVASGQVGNELYVKQLFARINLQIRRLSEGSASIAERLLRDALFFIARAPDPSLRLQQIRTAYQLDDLVPADYAIKRYGQVDAVALATARERLAQAKTLWNRIASGDFSVADGFEREMQGLSDAGMRLNAVPLSKLLRELNGIARAAATGKHGEQLGIEMATSLLFVENALGQISHLPDNFAERADAITARLLSIVAGDTLSGGTPWLDDMSREAQQRQTMTALTGELQSSLRHVEKMLEEYFANPQERSALAPINSILHQIGGALSVLDQDDAARAIAHTQTTLRGFAEAEELPLPVRFEQVARNIGALSFFLETLPLVTNDVRKRFSFDDRTGTFQANLIERPSLPSGAIDVDDPAAEEPELGLRASQATPAAAIEVPPIEVPPIEPMIAPLSEPMSELISPVMIEAVAEPAKSAVETQSVPMPFMVDDVAVAELQTVEQDLLRHQQQAAELARALIAEPDNTALRLQLKAALQQVRRDAALIDHPDANERARAAIALLDAPEFCASAATLATILAVGGPPVVAVAPAVAAVVAPESDEEIDAELLEIFLSEAVEVLAAVRATLPAARSEPYNQDPLTTLRRSFHTLKGSGRMVGLMAFGEAAWSIEQVLNLRLSDNSGGDAELFGLLDMAASTLEAWVDDLQRSARSDATPDTLVAAANRLLAGEPFQAGAAAVVAPAALAAPADDAAVLPAEPEEIDFTDSAMQVFQAADSGADDTPLHELTGSLDRIKPLRPAEESAFERVPEAAPEVPTALPPDREFEVASECQTAMQTETLTEMQPETLVELQLKSQPESQPESQPKSQPEPIAATAAVIDFPNLLTADIKRDDNVRHIGALEISVPLHNIYLAETDQLVRLLSQDLEEWRHEPERPVNVLAMHAAHSLAGSSATVGFKVLQEVAHALEMLLQHLSRTPIRVLEPEYDLLTHAVERIRFMLQMFALGEMPDAEPQVARMLLQLQQTLAERAEAVPLPTLSDDGSASFSADEKAHAQARLVASDVDLTVPDTAFDAGTTAEAELEELSAPISAPVPPLLPAPPLTSQAPVIEPALAPTFVKPAFISERDIAPETTVALKDELDADLMPVFIEEALDMLPQIGQTLRAWQQSPADAAAPQALLRLLHTIKGSARMAGAMRLGQHMHELESRIEQVMHSSQPSAQAMDDLLARHDQGLQMFDALQNPQATTGSGADLPYQPGAVDADAQAAMAATTTNTTNTPTTIPAGGAGERRVRLRPVVEPLTGVAAPVPMVRVRADMLDRLVNQAGEVSIARSKLENEVDTMRQSLVELTENLARLREQLREVEMQAESQIETQNTSRLTNSPEKEFDPLEFDRFTRLQELTRMMAESVNDVGSVQQNLARTLDSASLDLSNQARLTRDLQQDLMRVRMVQFASISERMFRVTRQASKEVDKRINLDIRGSAVEIDRSVLERMAGPFEHLLRNAIVHGIESRTARAAAGKREVGELLVEIRQEGNEVVIQFSDDGQGLDLSRIREKAAATGLIAADIALSEAELTDLIFHPGFTTQAVVTELAGRGVGMDVVRAEAAALGGRVAILTEAGKGAQFTIHLPLTLAVTQVVLLTTGGKTYAVPSVLVEQVQQLKVQALTVAYNEASVTWQSQRVPMAYLANLLGETGVTAVAQQYSPLLILKSGNDRIAIHVDEILGNREVVVKNIGPQLARLTGIAGATVLGSGEIVLILNPVALAQRAAQENGRAPRLGASDTPHDMGAAVEMNGAGGSPRVSQVVAGLRTQNIVMVVDDSLTVRRVTQRLLSREGYQVVLAKDGVDALEQMQSITPDVMLVDIEMPRMDGFDLTRNVRGDERTRHIPIIMITSRTASKHRNYAFELGVNEYLGKPYQEEALLAAVAGFLNQQPVVN